LNVTFKTEVEVSGLASEAGIDAAKCSFALLDVEQICGGCGGCIFLLDLAFAVAEVDADIAARPGKKGASGRATIGGTGSGSKMMSAAKLGALTRARKERESMARIVASQESII